VKIEAQTRAEGTKCPCVRRQNLVHIGIACINVAEAVLHDDGEAEVGTVAFQNINRGGGEDAISERPQPEDRQPAVSRQTF
jgi:hypothetical protein